MTDICAEMIPKDVCTDLLERFDGKPDFKIKSIQTWDETWNLELTLGKINATIRFYCPVGLADIPIK